MKQRALARSFLFHDLPLSASCATCMIRAAPEAAPTLVDKTPTVVKIAASGNLRKCESLRQVADPRHPDCRRVALSVIARRNCHARTRVLLSQTVNLRLGTAVRAGGRPGVFVGRQLGGWHMMNNRRNRLALEELEARNLLAVTAVVVDSDLLITGDAASDTLTVTNTAPGQFTLAGAV